MKTFKIDVRVRAENSEFDRGFGFQVKTSRASVAIGRCIDEAMRSARREGLRNIKTISTTSKEIVK